MSTQKLLFRLRGIASIPNLLTFLNIFFIGLGTWLAGDLAASIVEDRVLHVPRKEVKFVPTKTVIEDKQRSFGEFKAIIDNNVFDMAVESVAVVPEVVEVEETVTAGEVLRKIIADLELLGIHYRKGYYIFSIIKSKKNRKEDIFTVGDEIFESGAIVKRIFTTFDNQRVVIQLGKEIGVLTYTDEEKNEKSSGNTRSANKRSRSSSRKKPSVNTAVNNEYTSDGKNFYISASEVDGHLSNFGSLLNQARMVPYFKNGKHMGFKVKAIDRGSLYEKLGLKNNDVIYSVNGDSLSDAGGEKLMGLSKLLRTEREFTIEVERKGVIQTLSYYIN